MSSDGWVADHGSSRAHQHVRKRSMQAAKLSEGGGSSSQVPPAREESWQVKIARRRIRRVPRVVLWLLENILPYLFQLVEQFGAIMMRPLAVRVRPKINRELLIRQREDEAMKWVLDSGAWIHHTSNLDLLLDGGGFQFQDEINNKDATTSRSGDDDDAPHINVQGRGCVRTECFEFPGVRYVVGDDARNVVSVSQLARDHGLVAVFEPTSCHVKDKKTGQIVGKGRICNGKYMLDSLRIVGQYKGDGGSGSDRRDGADGSGGGDHEGRGNGTSEGLGGGGRDGMGGGAKTGATYQEEGRGNGDVSEINEEDSDEKEIQEMNENDEDEIKEIGEINDKGEKEEDEKGGGQNFGQLSSPPHKGLFGMSLLDRVLWIVSILCTAACILLWYTSWGAGVTILAVDFHSLAEFCFLFILSLQHFKTWMSKISKAEILGPYLQELSHQEHNKRLFGLSRFDVTMDPTGYWRRQLPAGAFPTSTNAARRDELLVDSGASFHATWKESILFPYPKPLQNHTKPPARSFVGIVGSIAVTRSGYLNGDNIMLDGVLLAPESRMNLVSVGQLSIQYGVQVEMDEVGVVIKKKQDGVQIGGGSMLNNHQYVLEYFKPGGLFAHSPTPNFKIFGRRRPGRPQ